MKELIKKDVYKNNMKLLLFIKNLLKNTINNNNLVVVLNLLMNINYFYIFIISFLISLMVWIPFKTISKFDIISGTKIAVPIIFIMTYSIPIITFVYMIFKHNSMPKRVLKYSNIGTSRYSKLSNSFSNFFEYFYKLLPICMVTTGIALATLFVYNIYFLLFGIVLFFLGGYVFFLLTILKITFYSMGTYNIYNNINRTNDILTNYISSNETDIKYLAIKEFTKHFIRVLDGIDSHFNAVFDKRINIDCLQNNGNLTVKQLVKRYLPIYLNYCSEAELNLFKIKMNSMVNLIDNENEIVSLDIIKIVHSIHQDIVKFLNQHSYVVPKNTLISNLIYKINKNSFIFVKIFVFTFIIIGLFKFFIPSEVLNKIFGTLNGNLSNLLGHDVNYIALILPFLASIPVLYKFLKELFE